MGRVSSVPGMSVSSKSITSAISRRFTRQQRLLSPNDYKVVFDDAEYRVSQKYFLLLARPNNKSHSRLGLVVGKKNVRQSVDRNRVKRVVRETFRLCVAFNVCLDVVFVARRGIDGLASDKQTDKLRSGWQQLASKAIVEIDGFSR